MLQRLRQLPLATYLALLAASIVLIVTVILAFVVQLIATRKTHDTALAGLPVIGKSHSLRTAGESVATIETTIPVK